MKIANHTKYDTAAIRRLVQAVYDRHRKTEGPHNRWSQMVITVRSGGPSGNAALGRRGIIDSHTAMIHGTRMVLRLPTPTHRELNTPELEPDQTCATCGATFDSGRSHHTTSTRSAHGIVISWWHVCTPKYKQVARALAKVRDIAALIEHELRHSYGEQHKRGHRCMSRKWDDAHVEEQAWTDGMFESDVMPLATAKPAPKRDVQSERFARITERERAWTSKLKRAQTALKKAPATAALLRAADGGQAKGVDKRLST